MEYRDSLRCIPEDRLDPELNDNSTLRRANKPSNPLLEGTVRALTRFHRLIGSRWAPKSHKRPGNLPITLKQNTARLKKILAWKTNKHSSEPELHPQHHDAVNRASVQTPIKLDDGLDEEVLQPGHDVEAGSSTGAKGRGRLPSVLESSGGGEETTPPSSDPAALNKTQDIINWVNQQPETVDFPPPNPDEPLQSGPPGADGGRVDPALDTNKHATAKSSETRTWCEKSSLRTTDCEKSWQEASIGVILVHDRETFQSQHGGIYALQMPSTALAAFQLPLSTRTRIDSRARSERLRTNTSGCSCTHKSIYLAPGDAPISSPPETVMTTIPSPAQGQRDEQTEGCKEVTTDSGGAKQTKLCSLPKTDTHILSVLGEHPLDSGSVEPDPSRSSVDRRSTAREFLVDGPSLDGRQSSEIASMFSKPPSPLVSSVSDRSLADIPEPRLDQTAQLVSDTEDTVSDVTDHTDTSLIEAFEASPTAFDPVLLSLFNSLREEVADRIKARLRTCPEEGIRERPSQPNSSISSQSGTPAGSAEKSSFVSILPRAIKRALDHEEDADDMRRGDGGHDDRKKQKDGPSKTQLADRLKKFACPFLKMYPDNESLSKSCRGPGWSSVHRVKEHIYRRHQQPTFRCTRCLFSFATEEHLTEHLRGEIRCQNNTAPPGDGILFITQSQGQALRKRKKEVAEKERWINVFRILFPNVPTESIPSPYHESYQNPLPSPAILSDFCEFLAQQLPSRITADVNNHLLFQPPGHESDVDMTGLFRSTIREVMEEFLPMLRFSNSQTNEAQVVGTNITAEEMPQEATPRPTTSSEDPSLDQEHTPAPTELYAVPFAWDVFPLSDTTSTSVFDFDFTTQGPAMDGHGAAPRSDIISGLGSWTTGDYSEFPGVSVIPS